MRRDSHIVLFFLVAIVWNGSLPSVEAWEWFPSDEETQKYRQMWNPLTHGPVFVTIADTLPKGQLYVRPFIYSQISKHQYGNQFVFASERQPSSTYLYSAQLPYLQFGYGLANHIQLGAAISLNTWWAKDTTANQGQGAWTTNTGLGDTSLYFKYRAVIQDPSTWRPTMTFHTQLGLPTGQWFTGTEKPPGGFAPVGRLPTTQFGSLALTEGVVLRKNLQPFRINAGVYYTYHPPGSQGGENTYVADLINARLIIEHILDERHGFAYNLELVGVHGVPWRVDGHDINRGPGNGSNLIAAGPTLQWRFGDSNFVAAAGVLFTVAGQNTLDSIFPNFSLFWYWSETGKVLMR